MSISREGRWIGRVDLADRRRRIVIECDGFETHGPRAAYARDLTRHTLLVAAGWRPLRLLWDQVIFEPDWVLEVVLDTIREVERSGMTTKPQSRRLAKAA